MCGLVGYLDVNGFAEPERAARLIAAMRDKIAHRGPDESGLWLDPAGVAFGFRRLSIIDLSSAGHQPALSADGRYVIMLNGEIYNFSELKAEIESVRGAVGWR